MRPKQIAGAGSVLAAAVTVAGCWLSAGIAFADPVPAPPPGPAPGPTTSIAGDGTFAVGTQVTPGTYSSAGPAGDHACYWKRVSDGKLVDNAMSKKAQVVLIEATDTTFKTSDCQPWQKIDDCLPGCGPQSASPVEILGQLGSMMAGRPSGPPPASGTP
jgi:hypothetical protein